MPGLSFRVCSEEGGGGLTILEGAREGEESDSKHEDAAADSADAGPMAPTRSQWLQRLMHSACGALQSALATGYIHQISSREPI